MRRTAMLALLAIVSVCLAGSYTESFRYAENSVKLGIEDGYTTVRYAGAPHMERLGVPDLPVLPYTVAIPAGAELVGLEVLSITEVPLEGDYQVMPVQHPVPYREDAPEQPFVAPDMEVYGRDAVFPAEPVRPGKAGNKAGYRLANFGIYPVRYNPVTGQLTVITDIRVRLEYRAGETSVPRRTETQIGIHGDAVRSLVLNPEDVDRYAPPKRTRSYGSTFLPSGTFEHVIITRSHWADSLQRLAQWRTRQGWRSTVMLLEDICATYPGRDTAEMMREFIKDADTTWGTIFVFIARDDYPAHQYRVARAYNYNLFSDMYFSDLDGDWDANGNNVFGENADNVDGYADVYVGMITLNGFTELSNYLDKLFRYEWNPDPTGEWTTKMLLPNGVTFSNEFNDSVAVATPSPPWFDLKMYSSGGMVTPTGQKYCDSLNSGYSLNSVIAHGSPDLYTVGSSVTSSMVLALTNANRMNFGTFVCCNVGEWNLGSTNGDCIAENSVFHAPNGFIGVCMNYESGWVRVAEFFNYSIMYGAVGFRTPRRVTMAEALSYGKDYWNFTLEDSAKWRMEAFERNLFGAPAVPVWTGAIYTANVMAPGVVNVGTGIPVPITVTDNAFAPVENALVCIHKDGETHDYAWTDAAGQVSLTSSCLTPGQLQLTVTCANNLPYLDSIPVVAAGRYVAYLDHMIDDSLGGNNDGIINPGETVVIPTWVKNYGDSMAYGVTAELITHATGATITDPTAAYGDIAGGDSALDAGAFEMEIGCGLPNGHPVPCSVVCGDNGYTDWVSYVTFYVGAPVIGYVDKQVRDQGSSNPNGKLDPGETAELEVTIANSGGGHAYNTTAILRSGDARLTVPDSTAGYGTVMVDSSRSNPGDRFTVTADPSIPIGTPVACTLLVSADNGYYDVIPFELIVGEIWAVDPIPDGPRRPSLYWAFEDTDTSYDQTPTYDWVEINSQGTRLNFSNNDAVLVVNLPSGFGPLQFYGQNYNQISVCADGWIAAGSYTTSDYTNDPLPSSAAPRAVFCPNWDDLYPGYSGQGYVYYYHDAANHRFIVEWDSTPYYNQRSIRDKFQVVFYDTTMTSPSGDNQVLFQYSSANQTNSSTVGIQDHTKQIGIQVLFDGTYDDGACPIEPGRAILFTTFDPTGVAEPVKPSLFARRPLATTPNPFTRSTRIHFQLSHDTEAELSVFDASGRAVRTLMSGPAKAGIHSLAWNGLDNRGRRVSRGIYFVRLKTPDEVSELKTILTR